MDPAELLCLLPLCLMMLQTFLLQLFRKDVLSKHTDLIRIIMASEALDGMSKVDSEISESSHFVDLPTGEYFFLVFQAACQGQGF